MYNERKPDLLSVSGQADAVLAVVAVVAVAEVILCVVVWQAVSRCRRAKPRTARLILIFCQITTRAKHEASESVSRL